MLLVMCMYVYTGPEVIIRYERGSVGNQCYAPIWLLLYKQRFCRVSGDTQALFMRLWQCLYIGTDFIAMFSLYVTVFLRGALRGSQSRGHH